MSLQDRIINLAVGLFSSAVVLVSTNLLPLLLLTRNASVWPCFNHLQKLLTLLFKVNTGRKKKRSKENRGAVTAAVISKILSYFWLGMLWYLFLLFWLDKRCVSAFQRVIIKLAFVTENPFVTLKWSLFQNKLAFFFQSRVENIDLTEFSTVALWNHRQWPE